MNVENLEASILIEQYFKKDDSQIFSDMVDRYFDIWKEEFNPLDFTYIYIYR